MIICSNSLERHRVGKQKKIGLDRKVTPKTFTPVPFLAKRVHAWKLLRLISIISPDYLYIICDRSIKGSDADRAPNSGRSRGRKSRRFELHGVQLFGR